MNNIFGLLIQIQSAMGVQVDFTLPIKFDKALENDKLTYIGFFASLESLQDPIVKPCINKALKYCEELAIPKTQKLHLNLVCQSVFLELCTQDPVQLSKGLESLNKLIKDLEGSSNELHQQKLIVLYCTQMALAESMNDVAGYARK
jgi:hypothetical protein